MKHLFSILGLVILASCSQESSVETEKSKNPFLNKSNASHHYEDFKEAGVLSADIQLTFGGKERMNGTLLFDTQTQETAILHKDGRSLYFVNDTVWMSPDTTNYPGARFDIFTWSYFFTLPQKLNDAGTHFQAYSDSMLNGKAFNTSKLTFGENVGDAPEDWYVLYQDKNSGLLHAAAYIVTLNRDKEKSEQDPHAIVYENYENVNGIPFSTHWKFYAWRKNKGLTQELGEAHISNISFSSRNDDQFRLPANKVEVKL